MKKLSSSQQKLVLEILILFASIPIFRGVWMLFDLFLFADDSLTSAFVSFGIGLIILIVSLYYFNKKDE
ncbi:MAG: hypothetical protein R6V50_00810 [Thermoplasmatota archaeon]